MFVEGRPAVRPPLDNANKRIKNIRIRFLKHEEVLRPSADKRINQNFLWLSGFVCDN